MLLCCSNHNDSAVLPTHPIAAEMPAGADGRRAPVASTETYDL